MLSVRIVLLVLFLVLLCVSAYLMSNPWQVSSYSNGIGCRANIYFTPLSTECYYYFFVCQQFNQCSTFYIVVQCVWLCVSFSFDTLCFVFVFIEFHEISCNKLQALAVYSFAFLYNINFIWTTRMNTNKKDAQEFCCWC